VVLAGMEWLRPYYDLAPNPVLYSIAAVLSVAYAAFRFVRALPALRALKLARDGERTVGQFLERLREKGYQVFHDVLGSGFNVDHAIIGPAGIFTVETKTWSKPTTRDAKVQFDGQTLKVAGIDADRDPVVQAKAQASWLRELLAESAGRKFPVRPVVLFPGWFVEQDKGSTREMWVLNPKALPDFLDYEPRALSDADIHLASFHLSRFIRAG
jgi:hypothetical protein